MKIGTPLCLFDFRALAFKGTSKVILPNWHAPYNGHYNDRSFLISFVFLLNKYLQLPEP